MAAVKYFRASTCERYMAFPQLLFLGSIEIRREAVGVHRRHLLQVSHERLSFRLGDAEVGHRPGPGTILLWIHQKSHHGPFPRVGAGDGLPSFPIGIEPSLGEIRRIIGAVAKEGVAVNAGPALDHHFAPLDQRCRSSGIQRPAEERLGLADHRHIDASLGNEFVVNVLVNDGVGGHVGAARSDSGQAVDGQHDQYGRHHHNRADRACAPKCRIIKVHSCRLVLQSLVASRSMMLLRNGASRGGRRRRWPAIGYSDGTMCSSTRRTPATLPARTRAARLSSSEWSTENQKCTTPSLTIMSAAQIFNHSFARNHSCSMSSASNFARMARSSPSLSVLASLLVAASARTRFALLTMPTSLPSRRTGTRLILLVSSSIAISASSVVSVTEITSRVMTSSAVRPYDFR